MECVELAIFNRYSTVPRKRYKIWTQLWWNT